MKNIIISGAVLIILGLVALFYIPSKSTKIEVLDVTSSATVNIKNYSFSPTTLTVKTGTKISWTNEDPATHTVTSDSSDTFNSADLPKGASFSYTPTNPGTITYHCTIHPSMNGTIIVTN